MTQNKALTTLVTATTQIQYDTLSLTIPKSLPWDKWIGLIHSLAHMEKGVQFWIGDALNYGESCYGEKYSQALDDKQAKLWKQYAWVSNKVKKSLRKDLLLWSHHAEVAKLAPVEQRRFLKSAIDDDMTVRDLRREVRFFTMRQNGQAPQVDNAVTRLIHGDMLKELDGLGPFDLVVADPPYNVTAWEWDKIGTPDDFLRMTRAWLEAIRVTLNPSYNLFWFCAPMFAADIEMIFREMGMPVKSRVVWHRRNMAMGSDAKERFVDSWEMIFHIGTRPLNYPPEWDDGRFDVKIHAVPQSNFVQDTKLHETQKPLDLISNLVQYGSQVGDNVLDPFAGSGTTGAACGGTRFCVLIEKSDKHVSTIEQRLGITRDDTSGHHAV